jgi:hypothetical protein
MHIHMIINVALLNSISSFYFHNIIWFVESKSHIHKFFFPKKPCMVSYFLMFFVYLPSAIVQLLLNPSFQFYHNTICISRFKVKYSMGWTTIFINVFLMIPNNFCNIWIFVQALHGKLGHAPRKYILWCPFFCITL